MVPSEKKEPIVSLVEGVPDTEVLEKPKRRRFSAKYKRRIVEEAKQCREPGAVGSLLRREGLYASQLSKWRKAYEKGALDGLSKKRGPKAKPKDPRDRELEQLRRDKARLERKLMQAEKIIDVQKKLSDLLGIALDPQQIESSDSKRRKN